MNEFSAKLLLQTETATVWDVCCQGSCSHKSSEECSQSTHFVFPYRGVFVRHSGRDETVAEANQVLFFNAHEGYRISHPVQGGDACLSLAVSESLLEELAPKSLLRKNVSPTFHNPRQRIDPGTQAFAALLRHTLISNPSSVLEAETLVLELVCRVMGAQTGHGTQIEGGRRKIVDRAKLVLASDSARRWTLAQVAREVGVSPVYLTQLFQQIEGTPLSRYQLRLRLARSLDLIIEYDDLTALGLDLGFSSHSHFTSTFRKAYGRTPREFRQSARSQQREIRNHPSSFSPQVA